MGGKGGGGSNYYAQPADTTGYGTPEEAKVTLAKEAPLDISTYQQTVNTQKAAADATAKDPIPAVTATDGSDATKDTGSTVADAVLKPPDYWTSGGIKPRSAIKSSSLKTTQV